MKTMNFFGRERNVYRAALHTHSTTSDGKLTPAELIDLYQAERRMLSITMSGSKMSVLMRWRM